MNPTVCIFCGANPGNSAHILDEVKAFCELLITHDYDLVYGGGKSGLMGLIADQFLVAGKKVIGVRPQKLITDEDAHESLTELIIVKDMFERKQEMIQRSDIFIALPGGVGTLDEIIEVYTQVKIGFIHKFCGVLNTNQYYAGLEQLLQNMVDHTFLKEGHQAKLIMESAPAALAKKIVKFTRA